MVDILLFAGDLLLFKGDFLFELELAVLELVLVLFQLSYLGLIRLELHHACLQLLASTAGCILLHLAFTTIAKDLHGGQYVTVETV